MRGGEGVDAADHRREVRDEHPRVAGREVRAVSPGGADADGGKPALIVHREIDAELLIPRLPVGQTSFSALGHPLHRPGEIAGGMGREHELGIERVARAEAATGVGHQHPDALGIDVEHRREVVLDRMPALATDPQQVAIRVGVVVGEDPARLHERDDQTRAQHVDVGDVRGGCERNVHRGAVAVLPVEAAVVGKIVPDGRGVGRERSLDIDRARKRAVIHPHLLGPGLRRGQRLPHHEGDRLADVAHLVLGQRVLRGERHLTAVAIQIPVGLDVVERGDLHHPRRSEISRGVHREHLRDRERFHRVDLLDAGVRMERSHHRGKDLPGEAQVIGELTGPGEEAAIFPAADRLTDMRHAGTGDGRGQ